MSSLWENIKSFFLKVSQFFTDFFQSIADAFQWLLNAFLQLFIDAWEMLTDLPVWVFDQVLQLALTAIQQLDLSTLTSYTSTWGELPAEVLNVLGLIGLSEALGIITVAVLIRLVLQLIPFVRLGS